MNKEIPALRFIGLLMVWLIRCFMVLVEHQHLFVQDPNFLDTNDLQKCYSD